MFSMHLGMLLLRQGAAGNASSPQRYEAVTFLARTASPACQDPGLAHLQLDQGCARPDAGGQLREAVVRQEQLHQGCQPAEAVRQAAQPAGRWHTGFDSADQGRYLK